MAAVQLPRLRPLVLYLKAPVWAAPWPASTPDPSRRAARDAPASAAATATVHCGSDSPVAAAVLVWSGHGRGPARHPPSAASEHRTPCRPGPPSHLPCLASRVDADALASAASLPPPSSHPAPRLRSAPEGQPPLPPVPSQPQATSPTRRSRPRPHRASFCARSTDQQNPATGISITKTRCSASDVISSELDCCPT